MMPLVQEVPAQVRSLERFVPLLGQTAVDEARALAQGLHERLAGGVIWNVNSTAVGGGVAEMLHSLLGYARGAGLDVRWLTIGGAPEFFRITKRLHHALHGEHGDGSALDEAAHHVYAKTLSRNAVELRELVRPGDVVLLHDPQPAGLAPMLLAAGARVLWRCHIGADETNEEVELGWRFLARYLDGVGCMIFSRQRYVPARYRDGRASIVQPSIDAFSAKNIELDEHTVRSILVHVGILEGPPPPSPRYAFVRSDGTPGRVERSADILRLGRASAWETPLVVQVSRWDPLKDMLGVLRGFSILVQNHAAPTVDLVLAGPNVRAVADDPEGPAVFEAVYRAFLEQPPAIRAHVHLAMLPTADVEENAVIVNALQRHATIVAQKSLHEGFGLTVTEAMWKARPVIASAVGGIQDQIEDGVSGVLLRDPTDLDTFAGELHRVLADRALAERLGAAARARVRERFLGIRHLVQYGAIIERLLVA
ncbi:glycosyltransferase [Polyangium sorediatum]|uniref:Glycosyltransferase n=1 Tax=Polyangium sorediatum TaxID=889274 RepID=A0ABT6NJS5_9BACT|nr:glycosyltransferase [Polyangium sorediatum]MDI1428554.1 glycosyltransferase [Polyangium sorediatum]